jgi:hypothetical protein
VRKPGIHFRIKDYQTGKTITEKILAKVGGKKDVSPDEYVFVTFSLKEQGCQDEYYSIVISCFSSFLSGWRELCYTRVLLDCPQWQFCLCPFILRE